MRSENGRKWSEVYDRSLAKGDTTEQATAKMAAAAFVARELGSIGRSASSAASGLNNLSQASSLQTYDLDSRSQGGKVLVRKRSEVSGSE